MEDFLQKLKKVVRIVLYVPAISQSDCRKAGPYQLPCNNDDLLTGILGPYQEIRSPSLRVLLYCYVILFRPYFNLSSLLFRSSWIPKETFTDSHTSIKTNFSCWNTSSYSITHSIQTRSGWYT